MARLSWRSELYSHLPLIPLVSLFFFVVERREIVARGRYGVVAGLSFLVAGLAVYLAAFQVSGPGAGTRLTAVGFSAWMMTIGGFVCFFGVQAARVAIFPLGFLAYAIPLPEPLVERVVTFLLWGSGAFVQFFFQLFGVSFLREGLVFILSRVTIEIAPECSGIRSSIALFITATIAARLFLHSWWGRGVLLLAVLPLVMVKNAIRIVTLTLLAQYVDMHFLTGHWLHRSGGFLFFLISLALLGGILLLFRRIERRVSAGG